MKKEISQKSKRDHNESKEGATDKHKISAVVMWILVCVGGSFLPLLATIGIIVIADFGWQNVEWNNIVPDYVLIVFTISVNVIGIAFSVKNKRYMDIAHIFGMVAGIIAILCAILYYGLFSPKVETGNYGMGTLKLLSIISTIMLVVNSIFGVKITKWENLGDEETPIE